MVIKITSLLGAGGDLWVDLRVRTLAPPTSRAWHCIYVYRHYMYVYRHYICVYHGTT